MPELPEVETIRSDLAAVLLRRPVAQVRIRKPKMVQGSAAALARELVGLSFVDVQRRGKLLIFQLSNGQYVLVHLKMTGQLIFQEEATLVMGGHPAPWIDELPNKYSHIIITFENGATLYFNDMRQFGYMRLVDEKVLHDVLLRFGIEPLTDSFTLEALVKVLKGRRTALKNVLLDQPKIAGLGNIYVDEACFIAGVRPTRRADRVTAAETQRLFQAIKRVITKAVALRGTTFGTYRDGKGEKGNFVRLLKVYGRAGEQCKRCRDRVIVKTKVNGRGTVYCPRCQK